MFALAWTEASPVVGAILVGDCTNGGRGSRAGGEGNFCWINGRGVVGTEASETDGAILVGEVVGVGFEASAVVPVLGGGGFWITIGTDVSLLDPPTTCPVSPKGGNSPLAGSKISLLMGCGWLNIDGPLCGGRRLSLGS